MFYDADLLFPYLIENGYIPNSLWKDLNRETSHYTPSFFCLKCEPKCLHLFDVIVKDGRHFISYMSVFIFCKKHNLPIETFDFAIFEQA